MQMFCWLIKFSSIAFVALMIGVACESNKDVLELTSYGGSAPRTTLGPITSKYSEDSSCPEDWINAGYLGCFYFDNTEINRHLTWVEAMDSCSSIGGFLAEVITEEQADFLKSLATLEQSLTGIQKWWLGLSDFAHEGRWVWSYSGVESEFTQWAAKSPDTSADNKKDCVIMSAKDQFLWRDKLCYEKIQATPLCQRKLKQETTTTTTIFPGCPDGWSEFNQSCFQLIESLMSWTSASVNCQQLGGNLTSIHSQEENDFIDTMISAVTLNDVWIGGTVVEYMTFGWSDGSIWDYEHWISGQPNFGDQVSVVLDSANQGGWRDLDISGRARSVCRLY